MTTASRLAALLCLLAVGCGNDGAANAVASADAAATGGAAGSGGGQSQGGSSGTGGTAISGAGGASAATGGASTSGGGGSSLAGGSGGGSGTGAPPSDGAPGGSGGADGSGALDASADGAAPAARGATVPWLEYEAEDADTNAARIGPSRQLGDMASEASGRQAIKLDAAGKYVRFTSKRAANAIVVRYAIPDLGEGPGSWTTISVYVNGVFRQKISLSSRWSWTYGAFGNASPNDPGQGSPHHFYDEAHAIIGDIPAGAAVALQKDATDSAAYYIVDLIDLEQVPPPLAMPANFIPVTDCGATPNDDTDDQGPIQTCIDRARAQGKGLFIPAGTFKSVAKPLGVDSVTIRGAGMWYSVVSGFNAHFDCYGNACRYYDFAVFGDTILRNDASPESCFGGATGNGTVLENIWMEHSKVGYWVGPGANGLVIRGCRIRNLFADGVNLWKGTSNSVIEQTHLRNTGDDSLAAWSESSAPANTNNVFRFNTVQLPWMANCFGIYGGNATRIEDNVCADTVQYPGILLAQQFGSQPFSGTTSVLRNSLIRAGGYAYAQGQGALKFHADQGAMGGFLVRDLTIDAPSYSGIHVQGGNRLDNLRFENVTISAAGTTGIQLNSDANGTATTNALVVTSGGMNDQSKGAFVWVREAGNSGW